MNNDIKEILRKDFEKTFRKEFVDIILELPFSNLLDYITNLQEENEELKVENEKLTQLWLNSQEKRKKAIECIKQELKDKNIDIGLKAILELLLSILKGD